MDDELLTSDIYSDEEIYTEFQQCCEEARLYAGGSPAELQEAAKALVRILSRNFKVIGAAKRNLGPR
jgi:hypothetical protein